MLAGEAHSAAISEAARAGGGAIQNASWPAEPARNMRTGLSNVIVRLPPSPISTRGPISPAPTVERSGGERPGAASDTEMTRGRPPGGGGGGGEEEAATLAVAPAANVTTASGGAPGPPGPSAVTVKSPPGGNVPLTGDRSIDGDGPATLRTTESAVMGIGAPAGGAVEGGEAPPPVALGPAAAVPLVRTDTAAGSIGSTMDWAPASASKGLPARSSNEPASTAIVPDAPPARAGEPSSTVRAEPEPPTEETGTAAESASATDRSAASTPATGSSNCSDSDDGPSARARTALGPCPSDTPMGPAPPKAYPAPERGAIASVPVASAGASAGSNARACTADSPEPPTRVTVRAAPSTDRA